MTIPQFKRDFQLDNNTGDDIHATLARYHIGLELVHRSEKLVPGWLVNSKYFAGIRQENGKKWLKNGPNGLKIPLKD